MSDYEHLAKRAFAGKGDFRRLFRLWEEQDPRAAQAWIASTEGMFPANRAERRLWKRRGLI